MTTCTRCDGTRRVTITVPNVRKYNGVEYVSSNQPEKPEVHVCPACNGAGGWECDQCMDSGEVWCMDTDGDAAFDHYCPCAAGVAASRKNDAELAAIFAKTAAPFVAETAF